MPHAMQAEFERALMGRGGALAVGLDITFGGYVDNDNIGFEPTATLSTEPGVTPDELPTRGMLLVHRGTLAPPRHESFALGWFLSEKLGEKVAEVAGGAAKLADKLQELASEFQEVLATDKYTFSESTGTVSDDMWNDYLAGELPPNITWLVFELRGVFEDPETIYLAWPDSVLERMFGPVEAPAPPPAAPSPPEPKPVEPAVDEFPQFDFAALAAEAARTAPPPPPPAPTRGISPGVARLLRTKVPIIVTLASKDLPTSKLLDIGPGAIIEFDRGYNEPLQLSVNNLPIGMGEAVKIGDHFGLKVTAILSLEERVRQLGGKWKF